MVRFLYFSSNVKILVVSRLCNLSMYIVIPKTTTKKNLYGDKLKTTSQTLECITKKYSNTAKENGKKGKVITRRRNQKIKL